MILQTNFFFGIGIIFFKAKICITKIIESILIVEFDEKIILIIFITLSRLLMSNNSQVI